MYKKQKAIRIADDDMKTNSMQEGSTEQLKGSKIKGSIQSKNTLKEQDSNLWIKEVERIKTIKNWIEKIEETDLSKEDFFKENEVPFSVSQYFAYRKKLKELGEEGLLDKRLQSVREKFNLKATSRAKKGSKQSKKTRKKQDVSLSTKEIERIKKIKSWLQKIEESELSIEEFLRKNEVPFSRAQYFLYRKRLKEFGEEGLLNKRRQLSRKKLTRKAASDIEKDTNPSKSTQDEFLNMKEAKRMAMIKSWLQKIEESELSKKEFFEKNKVPFSPSKYFAYRRNLKKFGEEGLIDKRSHSRRKKLTPEAENFIEICTASNPNVEPNWIREQLEERFGIKMTSSGIAAALKRIAPELKKRAIGRPRVHEKIEHNKCGGLEMIASLAINLGWPQLVSEVIEEKKKSLKKTKAFQLNGAYVDKEGRDEKGRFTKAYTERKDVNENRFKSIEEKRAKKNWLSMNIMRDDEKSIERKNFAGLFLSLFTNNGNIRTVNTALGNDLGHICLTDYKQATLTKYFSELKYLGISEDLLKKTMGFWKEHWRNEKKQDIVNLEKSTTGNSIKSSNEAESIASDYNGQIYQCFYIDGNNKAVWSSNRVKQSKVTMLGRVMGCLEQVFIHDGFGRPIYFETYSGHAPVGEHVLKMMEKVEEAIEEVPGSTTTVNRVLIIDGASNSAKTLRSFAAQKKYHYITPLDDNQWNERKINWIGKPQRYQYGEATLREIVLELEDSQEKGYLIKSRAIKIDWDYGKKTVLMTSLPLDVVDASEIVRSYFNRWPAQELQFKEMKSAVALHRVAGYGKQEIEDKNVIERQKYLAEKLKELKEALKEPLEEISEHEQSIAKIIPKERHLRNQSTLRDGKRDLPKSLMQELDSYGKEINHHNRAIKKIENAHAKNFKLLKKYNREWLRLQGKETVYKMDVELDQIMTFYRISLANLYAYFIKHFLGGDPMSMIGLLHRVLFLGATIKQTSKVRKVILHYNKKDKLMMEKVAGAIEKLNALNVVNLQGKKMVFSLEEDV